MNKTSKTPRRSAARSIWNWRRWIAADRQDFWKSRLEAAGCATWTFTERPDRVRVLLAVCQTERSAAVALQRQFGGQVRFLSDREWMPFGPTPPTRIGRVLEIAHEPTAPGTANLPRLHVPHGMAFGSGDHATTSMMLRAVMSPDSWTAATVLDLGTGSGVLALAARLRGARKIIAIDFDADAVRTARQNELLNFDTPLVRWKCADVGQLRATVRYDLVLANLFSGILCEAASPIAGSVAPGGELWLTGILRSQQESVVVAYRRRRMRLVRAVARGKWVMLQWRAPG